MDTQRSHAWIIASYRRDRQQAVQAMNRLTDTSYIIDCHRNLRGPYTGTGELLRQLAPQVYQTYPAIVNAHATEILSVAPELKSLAVSSDETLTSLAQGEERTIYYSHLRTLHLAHGIVDFLLEFASEQADGCDKIGPYAVVFENVHMADTLDQEFLTILLRRADPDQLLITVNTALELLTEPLRSALTTHAQAIQLPSSNEATLPLTIEQYTPEQRVSMARAYIESDCTTDNPLEKAAYDALEPAARQQWHDTRAEELEKQGQWTLHLGAIPYHRERGQDQAGSGVRTLDAALKYCLDMAFYEAAVDFGYRGRKLIDWEKQIDTYWSFTKDITTALAALSRGVEAEELFNEARELTDKPAIHMHAAYATAMLYTRHHDPERRNLHIAKRWAQEAIAIAQLLPDPRERTFHTVFNQNGLALIEVRLGRPYEAQRLVVEGLARLDRELGPEEHLLQRSVMIYNRAQVNNVFGRYDQAIADFTTLITMDPHYSEHYFERGNIYRRLGRNEEALEDYSAAIRYGPPYPEVYYNRAGVLSILGRDDEALSDYGYVLQLDPNNIDALINRASMLYERGEYTAARRDVERGLALNPDNAQLLCTLGLIEMEEQRPEEAQRALTSALQHDPKLIAAWINRAVLEFERGNADAAITDLSHALEISENATVLYNRGLAYQSQERWQEAIADYTRALELSSDDAQDILYQRGVCYAKLGNASLARQDFDAHLAIGPSTYAEEIRQLDPLLTNTQ
jgi:tetratricopeptide (TPR) repeat protein